MINRIKASVLIKWESFKRTQRVRANNHLTYGPAKVSLNNDEAAVVSLMKNAAYYINAFIEHHQSLGVKHIVIIDNGSTDDTVTIASSYDNVTVLKNMLPAKEFETSLRSEAAKKVIKGGWIIFVDSDELFETAGGKLQTLLQYLEENKYTAMQTQMLDLYEPDSRYLECKNSNYNEVIERCNHYSLENILLDPYSNINNSSYGWFLSQIKCNSTNTNLKTGGVRHEIFGELCLLTKHSLVRNIKGIKLMIHPHFAANVNLADVSGLLRHYKLGGDYLARDKKSVEAKLWGHNEDLTRLTVAQDSGDMDQFIISPKKPHTYEGPKKLIDQGFLTASNRYLEFISS
jgi:glycosyltransferase involved in cell wall biosynthesis